MMERKMDTTIVYWGYMGIVEQENGDYFYTGGLYVNNGKEMETTCRYGFSVLRFPSRCPHCTLSIFHFWRLLCKAEH